MNTITEFAIALTVVMSLLALAFHIDRPQTAPSVVASFGWVDRL
jgi:hypothetical protein